jgi:hypothetical protein
MGAIKAAGQVLLSSAEWSPRVEHASDEEGNKEEVVSGATEKVNVVKAAINHAVQKTMIKMS